MTTSDDDSHSRFRIRSTKPDQERKPDIQQVNSLVLSEGPRSLREVVHYAISSRHTGESKGNDLTPVVHPGEARVPG